MSAVTRPRGPLPARVYWFRRALVLIIAALLVVVLARVLTGGSDATSGGGEVAARLVGDTPTSDRSTAPDEELTPAAGTSTETTSASPQTKAEKKAAKKAKEAEEEAAPTEPPLPEPTGECRNDDIVVKPVITRSHAGSRVELDLEISTRETAACTWSASRSTLVVNITSGKDDIWTTRHCSGGLSRPVSVTARQETPAIVPMHWSGRRSDAECSKLTSWALPGFYHVQVAALGGEPTSTQFELGKAQPATVTKTVQPKPKKKGKKNKSKNRNRPGNQPTEEPLGDGTDGAVEPNG